MLRPSPRGQALLRVSAPTCLPRCQAGGRVAGEPRGQREQGPNPLPLHLCVLVLAWHSGRHCRALCELLREQHSVSRGATNTRHSRVTGLGVCPLESYNPLELGGFTNQKQATAMGGLGDEVEAGTVRVRGGAGGRLRIENRSSGT